jgi:hypothetical protein
MAMPGSANAIIVRTIPCVFIFKFFSDRNIGGRLPEQSAVGSERSFV